MKIIYITGPVGSGKTTLESNIRYQLDVFGKKGDIVKSADVTFIGRMTRESGRIIKFGGLDAYEGNLEEEINNQYKEGTEYIVFSGKRDLKQMAKELPYYFSTYIQKRRASRIHSQRKERRSKKKIYDFEEEMKGINGEVNWAKNELARWKKLQKENRGIYAEMLKGSTKERIQTLLDAIDKPMKYNRIIRKLHSERYRKLAR